jgi:hypothetical protein
VTYNPKTHDSLFKWLITAFTKEFFAHYFPALKIGAYRFIDKEFISKYEALKESLKGDLFLMLEVEIDGVFQEVAIQIEHQSKKEDISERLFEYLCYVWLLKKKPVWSIVIYTDEAIWRKPVTDKFHYGFSIQHPKQFFHFDVIKVKNEKSCDLIQKHSLLCKLLALKANDKGTDPKKLVYDIYQTVAKMKHQLTADQLLLINQWVDYYKKIPTQTFEEIKQEVNMEYIETTITEHIQNQAMRKGMQEGMQKGMQEGMQKGMQEGMQQGMQEGEAKGKILGQLEYCEQLYKLGILPEPMYIQTTTSLRQQLEALPK